MCLILVSLTLGFFLPKSKNQPVSHAAVRMVLDQTPEYRLTLKTMGVEKAYYSDYQLKVPFGYYNLVILGDKDKVLFSGKVGKDRVSFPPYEVGEEEDSTLANVLSEPLPEITVYLPYYPSAKFIVFLDENGKEVLRVGVDKIKPPKDILK